MNNKLEKRSIRSRYVLGMAALIVLLSVLLSVFVLNKAFVKLQYTRVFPLGFKPSIAQSLAPAKATNTPRLLMLGDSRVQMWPKSLTVKGYEMKNIAHGGQTSTQVVLQVLQQNIPEGKLAFVQVCVNDIHSLKGFMHERDYVIQQCKNNIAFLVKTLSEKGYRVVLSTLYPPDSPPLKRWLYWPDDFEGIFDDINAFIKSQQSDNVVILDAFALLKQDNTPFLAEKYIDPDFFLHVNDDAYRALHQALSKIAFEF